MQSKPRSEHGPNTDQISVSFVFHPWRSPCSVLRFHLRNTHNFRGSQRPDRKACVNPMLSIVYSDGGDVQQSPQNAKALAAHLLTETCRARHSEKSYWLAKWRRPRISRITRITAAAVSAISALSAVSYSWALGSYRKGSAENLTNCDKPRQRGANRGSSGIRTCNHRRHLTTKDTKHTKRNEATDGNTDGTRIITTVSGVLS